LNGSRNVGLQLFVITYIYNCKSALVVLEVRAKAYLKIENSTDMTCKNQRKGARVFT